MGPGGMAPKDSHKPDILPCGHCGKDAYPERLTVIRGDEIFAQVRIKCPSYHRNGKTGEITGCPIQIEETRIETVPKFPQKLKDRITNLGLPLHELSTTAGLGRHSLAQSIRKDMVSPETLDKVESAVKRLEVENAAGAAIESEPVPAIPKKVPMAVERWAREHGEAKNSREGGVPMEETGPDSPSCASAALPPEKGTATIKPATVWELAEAMELAASNLRAADPDGHVFEAVLKRVQR